MAEEIIIDAENAVLGRLASYSAKQALLGKKIEIVNCEKAIIVGREEDIFNKYIKRRARGGYGKGPFISKEPEKILKRTIRNMLPYKQGRGKEAFKRIRCYYGVPENFKDRKMIKSSGKRKGVSLERISKILGRK